MLSTHISHNHQKLMNAISGPVRWCGREKKKIRIFENYSQFFSCKTQQEWNRIETSPFFRLSCSRCKTRVIKKGTHGFSSHIHRRCLWFHQNQSILGSSYQAGVFLSFIYSDKFDFIDALKRGCNVMIDSQPWPGIESGGSTLQTLEPSDVASAR